MNQGAIDAEDAPRIAGVIERVSFHNPENGWSVLRVRVEDRKDLVVVVGSVADPTPGQSIEVQGRWTTHQRFGEQFAADEIKTLLPSTADGVRSWLGSGLVKGVGKRYAAKIVELFGEKTIEVIEREPERLAEIKGLTKKRAEALKDAVIAQRAVRDVMVFLQSHGVSPAFAARIFKEYGDETVPVIRADPYRLAREVFGIGFLGADRVARSLGFGAEHPARLEAGLAHALATAGDDGHVFLPRDQLLDRGAKLLGVDPEELESALIRLVNRKKFTTEERADQPPAVYTTRMHRLEVETAEMVLDLKNAPRGISPQNPKDLDAALKAEFPLTLAENQRRAVALVLQNKVSIITGGPGTGKTTIIKAVLALYSKVTRRIALAAPTGRAAKRLEEASGREAKTIHRLLEFSPQEGGFNRNEQTPLSCDLLIVDEASMIDAGLMHHLVKALPKHAALVLVGDVDQLPSVGPGRILADCIDSEALAVVELTEVFRQAGESSIIQAAHRINRGELPPLSPRKDPDDFYFIEEDDPERMVDKIVFTAAKRIPERFGLDPFTDVQVLTPMHKGPVGAQNLNAALQAALNPEGRSVDRFGKTFRKGDKVMQIRNNYEKDVYNGDIGRIQSVDFEDAFLTVLYDDRVVAYDFAELDELAPAYAVSVHKSQGSEYPAVVMPLSTQHFVLLKRNLLYTGVTRGKQLVVLIGQRRALNLAVKNIGDPRRFTGLAERLGDGPASRPLPLLDPNRSGKKA